MHHPFSRRVQTAAELLPVCLRVSDIRCYCVSGLELLLFKTSPQGYVFIHLINELDVCSFDFRERRGEKYIDVRGTAVSCLLYVPPWVSPPRRTHNPLVPGQGSDSRSCCCPAEASSDCLTSHTAALVSAQARRREAVRLAKCESDFGAGVAGPGPLVWGLLLRLAAPVPRDLHSRRKRRLLLDDSPQGAACAAQAQAQLHRRRCHADRGPGPGGWPQPTAYVHGIGFLKGTNGEAVSGPS